MSEKDKTQPEGLEDNTLDTMKSVEDVMKKYDRESNTRLWVGMPKKVLRMITALFGVFLIYMNMFSTMDERARRSIFIGVLILLTFVYYPRKKGGPQRTNYIPWYDIILALAGSFCYLFYAFNLKAIVKVGTRIRSIFTIDIGGITIPLLIVFAIAGTLILVECCRRVVGLPIICVATVFVIYAFVGGGKSLSTVSYKWCYLRILNSEIIPLSGFAAV